MSDSQRLFEQAIEHQNAGRDEAAEWLYRAVVALDSQHAEANHRLGLLEYQSGQIDSGLAHLQTAVNCAPESIDFRLALANALLQTQRPLDAQTALDTAPMPLPNTPAVMTLRQQIIQIINPNQPTAFDHNTLNGNSEPTPAIEMNDTLLVTIADEVRVCVPADIHSQTTYVLLEQGDWCDDEMLFVRQFIQPGMVAVDVGAQHGAYALTLAKRLNGNGAVIALEPVKKVAHLLTQSVIENELNDVMTVLPVGLANHSGQIDISIRADRKPNSLQGDRTTETVTLLKLDELIENSRWPTTAPVDFLRINAGGLELDVLQSGAVFFNHNAPLVLLRVTETTLSPQLCAFVNTLNWQFYRLIPGINALFLIDPTQPLDAHQRNLFICDNACAERLQQRGLLIDQTQFTALSAMQPYQMLWPLDLANYHYAQPLLIGWQIADHSKDERWQDYQMALNCYLLSQDHKQPLTARYQRLLESLQRFHQLIETGDGHLATYMVFIRILFDLGEKQSAVYQIEELIQKMTWLLEPLHEDLRIQISRPFLPLTHDFDQRPVAGDIGTWVQAAVIEALETKRSPSSYFQNDLYLLKKVLANANHGAAMERRERLLNLRLGMPKSTAPKSIQTGRRRQKIDPNTAAWERLENNN
ncbi:hypothetical protein CKO09_07695 [Chromatium weissei]|nr:hypothetical protein [Chromatium weissei]